MSSSQGVINSNLNITQDKKSRTQLQAVYEVFKTPRTMLEADFACGIMRSNICYHIAKLYEQNRIALIKKRKCSITGFTAGVYTTDPDLFPVSSQLKMF